MNTNQRNPRLAVLILAAVVAVLAVSCKSPTGGLYGGGSTSGSGTGGGTGGGAGATFNYGPFAIGESVERTFSAAGAVGYHCTPHRNMGMVGTVQVDANGADSMLVRIGQTGFSFTPATAHIKPGGYVRWLNVSNLAVHTVTSD
jgi:plastocyanin